MKNKQLETLLDIKNQIDDVLISQGHSNLMDALTNNTVINTPKINEILNLIGEINDGSVKSHLDNIKSEIVDVNSSREEYVSEINLLLNEINNVINTAKAPYGTLKEAIENTNTNVQINSTDNEINLIAERFSEVEESTFYIGKNQTKQIEKIEPGNKMTHYLVEHNLGEKQFNFSIDNFKSLDKNHNLDDNIYANSSTTSFGSEMLTLDHEIINTFYENGYYFYETKDYMISTDGEVSEDDIYKLMNYSYPDTLNEDCTELYILFKNRYYMDAEIQIDNHYFFYPSRFLYKAYSGNAFTSFIDVSNYNVAYKKRENQIFRLMRFQLQPEYNLRARFKILNIPEQSYIDTNYKMITLNEIRNFKTINAEGQNSKHLIDINNQNYSFINKDYTINKYEFLIEDYVRQYHINNNEYNSLIQNFENKSNVYFLNNYIIPNRQNGNMRYDLIINENESVFHTEHNNAYSGEYTSMNSLIFYVTANGTTMSCNINIFKIQRVTHNFNGKIGVFDIGIQRVNENIFVYKIELDEEASSLIADELSSIYFYFYLDDSPSWGSDGLDNYHGDTRVTTDSLNFDINKLKENGIVRSRDEQYQEINYARTYNYDAQYNNYEIVAFDKNLKAKNFNLNGITSSISQNYNSRYGTVGYYRISNFSNIDNESSFQLPLYFVIKLSKSAHEGYFVDDVEDIMINIKNENLFNISINLDSNAVSQKSFKTKIRNKTINNQILRAVKIKEVITAGDFVKFSISDSKDDFKIFNPNTNNMEVITDIFQFGMTKEEVKAIPESIINNMSSITIKYIELKNSEFESIVFETIGDRLIKVDSEDDYYDFGFTTTNIHGNIEKYYEEIKRLDDFDPDKTVRLKMIMDNRYKHRGYYIKSPHLDTFESSYLETPTIDELTKIRIRDFERYYEFENLTNQDKVIKLYQNKHENLKLIDQQSGNDISTILYNANALTDNELFKERIINVLTEDIRINLLDSLMAEVNTVNHSYAKEFTTEYFFDAAASKIYTLPISSQDIMVRVEKFITDNTINYDNRMVDVNIENYLSTNIQLTNSYYTNKVKYEEKDFLNLPNFDEYAMKEIVISEVLNDIKEIIEEVE